MGVGVVNKMGGQDEKPVVSIPFLVHFQAYEYPKIYTGDYAQTTLCLPPELTLANYRIKFRISTNGRNGKIPTGDNSYYDMAPIIAFFPETQELKDNSTMRLSVQISQDLYEQVTTITSLPTFEFYGPAIQYHPIVPCNVYGVAFHYNTQLTAQSTVSPLNIWGAYYLCWMDLYK